MAKLNVLIDRDGFTLEEADDGAYQSLPGGIGRSRLDLEEATYIATVKWTVGPGDFETINDFYLANEHLPFEIDLVTNYAFPEECTAYFIPETFSLDNIEGNTYSLSAKLEVIPPDIDLEFEEWILTESEIYPDMNASEVFILLQQLVNENLPGIG